MLPWSLILVLPCKLSLQESIQVYPPQRNVFTPQNIPNNPFNKKIREKISYQIKGHLNQSSN